LTGLAVSNLVTISPKALPMLYAIPVGASCIALVVMVTASQPRVSLWVAQTITPLIDAALLRFQRLFERPVKAAGS
ncbi:MAG: hypothetical protein ACRETL_05565, partial [Gammaproteobacteria bacterium]